MNTTTQTLARPTGASPATPRTEEPPVTTTHLWRVELAKMFNTRSGTWLVASVVILSLLAAAGVMVFGGAEATTYANYSAAVGIPVATILPMLAILSVTSEFSQRTGLTTFTLVPHRGRVIAAKLVVALGVGVVSILAATLIGALGYVLAATIHSADIVWDVTAAEVALVVLANMISMLMGFTLGVVIRNSPAAIVAYFVYSLILPNILGALAFYQEWFMDIWPWVDLFYSTTNLYEGVPTAEGWAQLASAATIWLVVPLAVGLRLIGRAEVK